MGVGAPSRTVRGAVEVGMGRQLYGSSIIMLVVQDFFGRGFTCIYEPMVIFTA